MKWSKRDKIEHRGHQIEDPHLKIDIPRSKYSRKAQKNQKWPSSFSNFLNNFSWIRGFLFQFLFSVQTRNCRIKKINLLQREIQEAHFCASNSNFHLFLKSRKTSIPQSISINGNLVLTRALYDSGGLIIKLWSIQEGQRCWRRQQEAHLGLAKALLGICFYMFFI